MTEKKVSKLKAKKPEDVKPRKPKMVVFSRAGVGKTWALLDFPNTYYIDTEGGADLKHYQEKLKKSGGEYLGVAEGSTDPVTILEQVELLGTEKHNFKTLVIDSMSMLAGKMIAEEQERLIKAKKEDGFGASQRTSVSWTRRLMLWLEKIDMNVVLVCHEKDEWKDSKVIGTTFDAWAKLDYYMHMVFNIQKRGTARIAIAKKCRAEEMDEGDNFEWSYEGFSKCFGKELVEKESVPLQLATPEQVNEINILLGVFKMTEEEIEKWFSKAKVERWQDMEMGTIQKCIDFLKSKATTTNEGKK